MSAETENNAEIKHRAYKTELAPNNKQRSLFEQFAGCSRRVYNWAKHRREEEYEKQKAEEECPRSFHGPGAGELLPLSTTFPAQSRELTERKKDEFAWMFNIPRSVQDEALRDCDFAFKNFFRRIKEGKTGKEAGYPKFKSKYNSTKHFRIKSKGHANAIKRVDSTLKIPGIGMVRIKPHDRGYIPEKDIKILSVTISESHGRWFAAVLSEEQEAVVHNEKKDEIIGIDLGIRRLATVSNGTIIENPRYLDALQKKLRNLQKKQSRQRNRCPNCHKSSITIKKGSHAECKTCGNKFRLRQPSNRALITKAKISKVHQDIANKRNDYIHRATTEIIRLAPKAIVIENLNIKGMFQDSHISRSLGDAALSEFRRQIEYKARWAGISVIVADRWFPSSKTCSGCGNIKQDLSRGAEKYICDECGLVIDRDLNAAINLSNYEEKGNNDEKTS